MSALPDREAVREREARMEAMKPIDDPAFPAFQSRKKHTDDFHDKTDTGSTLPASLLIRRYKDRKFNSERHLSYWMNQYAETGDEDALQAIHYAQLTLNSITTKLDQYSQPGAVIESPIKPPTQ